jgi:hypothetical protein
MYVDVFFNTDKAAQPILDGVFVNVQGLNDDNSAFHFPFYHVDVCIASAMQRF